ncbi:MAG: 16S rRNA (cytosine(1402)-N(4))-methyltransferase RsmH [Legionellales bacterium]|nr:16S rRNA (cytosine(1402)-N(4))-methyltransferase RsmH [Legionellales bacterium]
MKKDVAHKTVLLDEAIEYLNVRAEGIYIDATFGRGGHSRKILQYLQGSGKLLAFDKDPEAEKNANELAQADKRFSFVRGSFTQLLKECEARNWMEKITGIIFDLGVSSPQLDDALRGFSFLRDGPLDMRMDPSQGQSVKDWLAEVKLETLITVLRTYGEERYAKRIAQAIINERGKEPITTTACLAAIIAKAHPNWEPGKHPATLSFQALRIFINRELEEIEQGLAQSLQVLASRGRLVVISFHSLEDRIVKRFMRDESKGDNFPADLPITEDMLVPRLQIIGKAIRPGQLEIDNNPRARSGVMRVAEKLQ